MPRRNNVVSCPVPPLFDNVIPGTVRNTSSTVLACFSSMSLRVITVTGARVSFTVSAKREAVMRMVR